MKLVFASTNRNKIVEIQKLVPATIQILSLEDIGCLEAIPETAETIEGNAIIKAEYVSKKYGYACFADDSGLETEGLNGAPGVYSARFAGEPKDDVRNMEKLVSLLVDNPNKNANFKTVICLHYNGSQTLFEGKVFGKIITEPRGSNGFGYDPVFVPKGYDKTFAEMSMNEKNHISHRAIAVRKLIDFLEKQ